VQWQISGVEFNGVIQYNTLDQLRSSQEAWTEAKKFVDLGARRSLTWFMANQMFKKNSNYGALCTISAGSAGTFTCTSPGDAKIFSVGMRLDACATPGSGSLRAKTGTPTVLTVNTRTGVVTHSGTFTSITAGDSIGLEGELSTASTTYFGLHSAAAYCPDADPSDTFLNVARSVDPIKLGGVRVPSFSGTIAEGLIAGNYAMLAQGMFPDVAFVSPAAFARLMRTKDGVRTVSVRTDEDKSGYSVGFQGAELQGLGFGIPVFPDFTIPDLSSTTTTIWLANTEFLRLYYGGDELFNVTVEEQGASAAAAMERRLQSYAQFACLNPAALCRVDGATI